MSRDPILKSDWHDWKQHPITKALIHDLTALREQYKEDMANGHSEEDFKRFQGICQGFLDSLEYITYDFDVVDNSEEEKNEH